MPLVLVIDFHLWLGILFDTYQITGVIHKSMGFSCYGIVSDMPAEWKRGLQCQSCSFRFGVWPSSCRATVFLSSIFVLSR